jgi:hypothetical protein
MQKMCEHEVRQFTGQYIVLNSDKTSVSCLHDTGDDTLITSSYDKYNHDVTFKMSNTADFSILDGLRNIRQLFTSPRELNSAQPTYVIFKLNYLVYLNDKGEPRRWSWDEKFTELNDNTKYTTRLRRVNFEVTQVITRAYVDHFISQCVDKFIILKRDNSDNPEDNSVVCIDDVNPLVKGSYINKYVNFTTDSSMSIASGLDCLMDIFIRQNMPIGTTKPVYRIVKVNYLDYRCSSVFATTYRYSNEYTYHLYDYDNHIHCISFVVKRVCWNAPD